MGFKWVDREDLEVKYNKYNLFLKKINKEFPDGNFDEWSIGFQKDLLLTDVEYDVLEKMVKNKSSKGTEISRQLNIPKYKVYKSAGSLCAKLRMLPFDDIDLRLNRAKHSLTVLDLSLKTKVRLFRAGITSIPDIERYSDEDLLKIRGFGEKSLHNLRAALEKRM